MGVRLGHPPCTAGERVAGRLLGVHSPAAPAAGPTAGASSGRCRGLAVGGACRCAGIETPGGSWPSRWSRRSTSSTSQRKRRRSRYAGPSSLGLLACGLVSWFPWPHPTGPARCPPGRRCAPLASTPRRSAWTRCGSATTCCPARPRRAFTRAGRSWPRWPHRRAAWSWASWSCAAHFGTRRCWPRWPRPPTPSAAAIILGLGAGWYDQEYTAFSYLTDHRVGQFEEAISIIGPLLRGERVTLAGRYYQVREAVLSATRPADPDAGGGQGSAHAG